MAWFRNLTQIYTLKSSLTKPKFRNPSQQALFTSLFLHHFCTKPEPIQQTIQTQNPVKYSGLPATRPEEKSRVVVLGSGWAGCRLMKDIDTNIYDVVCVSPRNHMVFTPLLASTCVGTLEFMSVAEPIGRIQPSISREPGSYFFLANCTGIDPQNHLEIRRKLLLNLMPSDVPAWISDDEKRRLLHCVVVGGGPTGVEFSGKLSDFIRRDVHQRYAHVKNYIHVTLIETNKILSSFDDRLRRYAIRQLTKVLVSSSYMLSILYNSALSQLIIDLSFHFNGVYQSGVRLVRGIVQDVQPHRIILTGGSSVPYGLLVWSTGVGPSSLIKSLNLPKSPGGRIGIDEWLWVPSGQDVFAIGDCSGFLESTGKQVLPALAQVAERQGKYPAELLNRNGKAGGGRANSAKDVELGNKFVYKHLGSMLLLGDIRLLWTLGRVSWFIWRSAYLTCVISWRSRFYVAINWAATFCCPGQLNSHKAKSTGLSALFKESKIQE
ncbi:FAD/NAD(P)-binding domain [Dillenia turbinata]|uniref:FAD/NAD(P)-binding domain n=1 Tax=Dillenia turbinata TaxID=194707 RepID=A0AAN8VPY4_9MAGN